MSSDPFAPRAGGARRPLFDPTVGRSPGVERAEAADVRRQTGFVPRGGAGPSDPFFGDDDGVNWGSEPTVMAQAMVAEFGKIAGLRYENRNWTWNFDNVHRYFDEEPVWATIDAATIFAPGISKWGKAAWLVSREGSVAGQAYKAGQLGFGKAVALQAKNLRAGAVGPEFVRKAGRFVHNPVASERFTTEYASLLKDYAPNAWEKQAGLDVLRREYAAGVSAVRNRSMNVLAKLKKAGLSEAQEKQFIRAMEAGIDPSFDVSVKEAVSRALGEEGSAAFASAWDFRSKLGIDALELDMLSPENALKQDTYWPQMLKGQFGEALKKSKYQFGGDTMAEASWDNFKWRKYTGEQFEAKFKDQRDFSVENGVRRMSMAFQAVQREKLAKGLMDSGIVQTPADLLKTIGDVVNNPTARKLWGLTDAKVSVLQQALKAVPTKPDGTPVEEALFKVLRENTGWQRLSDVAPGLHLPKDYHDKLVDPAAAADLAAAFKMMTGEKGELAALYNAGMQFFRTGKTAYNPATHVRNIFGAHVFHTLATGLGQATDGRFWLRGFKAWRKGMDDAEYRLAAEAGVVDATIDRELMDAWARTYGDELPKTALDFLGDSRPAKLMQKLGGKAESFYRGIDEVSRLDAFIRNYRRFKKTNAHRVDTGAILQARARRTGLRQIEGGGLEAEVLPAQELLGAGGGPARPRPSDVRGMTTDAEVSAATEVEWPAPPEPRQLRPGALPPRQLPAQAGPGGAVLSPDPLPSAVMGAPPAEVARRGPRGTPLGELNGRWTPEELDRRAADFAALQVAKFIPSFQMHSRLSQLTKQHIPFSSFSHEAVRVWKNALMEKPHLVYFWNHVVESAGEFFGAAAGFQPDEIEQAKAGLPYYQAGKKMLMWPFAIAGKPVFVDMSYLMPLANIVEVERDEQQFFSKVLSLAGANPASNPLASAAMAAVTGIDPFKGRPLEPTFTERQLPGALGGGPIEGPRNRAAVGLVEHIAATFLPPVVPPGYVGTNLMELTRGQKHGQTGAPLEEGLGRSLATNLLGIRLHEADANAAMLNVGHENRRVNQLVSDWWERWQWAVSNGRDDDAQTAEANLYELQVGRGKTPAEAMDYLRKGVKSREPGMFRNFPKGQVRAALESLENLGLGESPQDAESLAAMAAASRNKRR
ncbi:MAG: hypothetical protein ACRD0Q_01245 [Acidimicrobiales bacterium]